MRSDICDWSTVCKLMESWPKRKLLALYTLFNEYGLCSGDARLGRTVQLLQPAAMIDTGCLQKSADIDKAASRIYNLS